MKTLIRRLWEKDIAFKKTIQILFEKKKNHEETIQEEWLTLYCEFKNRNEEAVALEVIPSTIQNNLNIHVSEVFAYKGSFLTEKVKAKPKKKKKKSKLKV